MNKLNFLDKIDKSLGVIQIIIIIIIIIYFQILKLHMVLFKLEMIQANTKLFFTEKKNHTNKSNTIKLP